MARAYFECAAWASDDYKDQTGGNPINHTHNWRELLAPETIAKAEVDCEAFAISFANMRAGWDDSQLGHDLWLTRNRHGAGFWDRECPETSLALYWREQRQSLTEGAHALGETDLYFGDDGKLYLQ